MSFEEIKKCRITGTEKLVQVLDLGKQALTGVFPDSSAPDPSAAPLELLVADDPDNCHLVQLRHNANIDEMYGASYGYHSSISPMMVEHLSEKHRDLLTRIDLSPGDAVLDIGCNDGTFLNLYDPKLRRVGIDPSSKKFISMFDDGISVAFDFFSEERVREITGSQQYKAISSIAMFYDIDDPISFMGQISNLLADDGVWLVEVAYMPTMMTNLAYDQVMHEHLTYLGLRQMQYMMDKVGLRMLDASLNYINGGSVSIIASKVGSPHRPNSAVIEGLLESEAPLVGMAAFHRFEARVKNHRDEVRSFLELAKDAGRSVMGYGASTKGNVVMSYCGVTPDLVSSICDRNPEKDGRVTPQTRIPIVSHESMRKNPPDILFTNIWHLRREVLSDEKEFIQAGGTFVFSLPRLHTVNAQNYERYLARDFDDLAFSL